MPGRDGQRKQDFILNQLSHIQFACHRQKISCVVFQLVLRHISAFRNKLQQAIDIQIKRNCAEATLTSQGNLPPNLQMQRVLATLSLRPLKTKSYLSINLSEQIMQAFKIHNRQCSFKNTAFTGKNKRVSNSFQS